LPDAVRDDAVDKPKVRFIKGIEFVDETESGRHFGLVGASGVRPWEDEQIRRELLQVLQCGIDETPEPSSG